MTHLCAGLLLCLSAAGGIQAESAGGQLAAPVWADLAFEGADDLIETMRKAYAERQIPADCGARTDATFSNNKEWFDYQKLYLRGGGDNDWYGHALQGVTNGSCNFVSHTFEPPKAFLDSVLNQQVYITPGQMKAQCEDQFRIRYSVVAALECARNNYNMMYDSVEDCEKHSMDADVGYGTGRQCRGSKCITRGAMMDILTPMIEKVTKNRVLPPPPYLVYAKNAVINGAWTLTGAGIPSQTMIETDGEIFSVSCAPYWQAQRGKTGPPGGANNREDVHALMHKCSEPGGTCPVQRFKKVMAISQVFHNQYFHFMIEIWPRIAPFVDGLNKDDDFMIQSTPDGGSIGMQTMFFELIGIKRSKIIAGPTFAEEVFIPRVGYSHNPHLNLWNLYSLRRAVEKLHGVEPPNADGTKTILIIRRDKGRRLDHRYFDDAFGQALEEGLPGYKVEWFTSSNHTLMHCLLCQVKRYQKADIILGAHGAGLSHLMWAKRGATVIENLGGGGDSLIYAEMAFIFGLKYFPSTNFPVSEIVDLARYSVFG